MTKTLCCILALFLYLPENIGQTPVLPISKLANQGIQFNHYPGLYDAPIVLKANHNKNIQLIYALNGDIPNSTSQKFKSELKLDTVAALTWGVIENGRLLDTFYCGTYIIKFKSVLPIASLIIPESFLFDPSSGIYTGGMDADSKTYGNCWKKMERPSFFEFYGKRSQSTISQYCGLRIFGGMTKGYPEKSLRIIARKKYGKGKFKGELFPTKPVKTFNSLVLRMSGNDYMSTRFQDILISSIANELKLDHMAYQPSVLFVNGQYWGIYNLREKIDRQYFNSNYGVSETSVNMLWANSSPSIGTAKDYKDMLNWIQNRSSNSLGFADSLSAKMDIDNFINYNILQTFIVNVDYRGNIRYWKSTELDNRFRWIYYDGDLGFANPQLNFLSKRLDSDATEWYAPSWSTFLLRRLVENKEIRHQFINQYCYLLSTYLSKDSILSKINYFQNWISPEIDRHLKRRNFSQSRYSWESHINRLRRFTNLRSQTAIEHVRATFNLSSLYKLTILNKEGENLSQIEINGNRLPGGHFSGYFFQDVPLSVNVVNIRPGYKFLKWSDGKSNQKRIIENNKDSLLVISPVFEKMSLADNFQSVKIHSLKLGLQDSLPWLALQADKANEFEGAFYDPVNEISIPVKIKGKGFHVFTTDTVGWRKIYKDSSISLHISSTFFFKKIPAEIFLTDASGALVDSTKFSNDIPANASLNTFASRNGLEMEITSAFPLRTDITSIKKANFEMSGTLPVLAASIIGLLIIIIMYYRKRLINKSGLFLAILFFLFAPNGEAQSPYTKRIMVNGAEIVLFSDGSWQYVRNLDYKGIFDSSVVEAKMSGEESCSNLFCEPITVEKDFIFLRSFDKGDLFDSLVIKNLDEEFYKELPADSYLQSRMTIKDRKIICMAAGKKVRKITIDSANSVYLLKIFHDNGLESWYYPLQEVTVDSSAIRAGEVIGFAKNACFWQLRFRNHSFLARGLLQSRSYSGNTGFLLETSNLTDPNWSYRQKAFLSSLKGISKYEEKKDNFEELLEKEMKKKKN